MDAWMRGWTLDVGRREEVRPAAKLERRSFRGGNLQVGRKEYVLCQQQLR